MAIVTARVTHGHFLPLRHSLGLRSEGEARLLFNGQGVDVRADAYKRPLTLTPVLERECVWVSGWKEGRG